MQILIDKDPATRIPREVASIEEAQAIQDAGMAVHLINEDGSLSPLPVIETKTYEDGTEATGVAPLPEDSPTKKAKKG